MYSSSSSCGSDLPDKFDGRIRVSETSLTGVVKGAVGVVGEAMASLKVKVGKWGPLGVRGLRSRSLP